MKLDYKKRKKNEPPAMYIKHLAESAIFEVITSKNIFSYFERSCNECQTFRIRDDVNYIKPRDMRYYLETNALYSIEKINKVCGDNCFTSVFSLFELISGLSEENFDKRRNLLIKLRHSNIGLDNSFPEEIIFESFDVMRDYEFVEDRVSALNIQIQGIIDSKKFVDFQYFNDKNQFDFNFDFFKFMDDNWNEGFVNATTVGNRRIKQVLEKENKVIFDNGHIIGLRNNKDLKKLLLYLRNDKGKAIVSSDRIFKRYFKGNVLNVEDLILIHKH